MSLLFSRFGVKGKFILTLCLHKSHTLKNSSSWVKSQNDINWLDCGFLKSVISQEEIDELTWFKAGR